MKIRVNIIFIIAIIIANLIFSEDCYPPGDSNWDGTLNILDIVLLASLILSGDN